MTENKPLVIKLLLTPCNERFLDKQLFHNEAYCEQLSKYYDARILITGRVYIQVRCIMTNTTHLTITDNN